MIFNSKTFALASCVLLALACSTEYGENGPFSSGKGNNLVDDGADGAYTGDNEADSNGNGSDGGKGQSLEQCEEEFGAGAKECEGLDKAGNPGGGADAGGADAGGGDAGNGGNGNSDLNKEDGESGNGSIGLDDTGGAGNIKCKYFDQDKRGSSDVKHTISGGPSLAIDMTKYTNGGGEKEGDDYLFQITVFDDDKNGDGESLTSGKYPIYYNAVIRDYKSANCSVEAERSGEGERTNLGCFLSSTQIRMADGKDKLISELKVGDQVWNPVTKAKVWVNEVISGPEKKAMYEVGYAGKGFMVVTAKHPFETKAGLKQAHELTKADQMLGSDGRFHSVSHLKVRPVDPKAVVWNLKLDSKSASPQSHMVLADGMVSGDLYLQRALEKARQAEKEPASVAKLAK
mgnify:CR=1 FL=1